jgi:hypothetical protein
VHITSRAAGLLAREMDGLPFLSHAFLSLGEADPRSDSVRGLLGVNGTSRMYRGMYDGLPVAIKVSMHHFLMSCYCILLSYHIVCSFNA